jgi:hypothetical protein
VFLDSNGVNPVEFHCHCSTGPEGMATDIVFGEAKLIKPHLLDGGFDGLVDIVGGDLAWVPWCLVIGADGGVVIVCVGHDMGDTSGKCFDGASDLTRAVVADALASCAILLVGNTKCSMSGCKEFGKRGSIGNDCLICPAENDVLDPEALCTCSCLRWFVGVLTNSKQKVEGDTNEVSNCTLLGVKGSQPLDDNVVGDRDGDGEFGLGCWVLPAVVLYLLVEGWPVDLLALVLVRGTGLVVQQEGLADGRQRFRDLFSSNSSFSSGISSAYPMGKGLDEGKALGLWKGMEEWVGNPEEGNELHPVPPVLVPGLVSLSHDPMGCRCRRSSAKTKEESLVCRVCMCQQASCDNGKEELNLVRKSASVRS